MGAANLTTHVPIVQALNKAGTTPFTSAQPEKAGQTFKFGTPVQLATGGLVQAWDGTTVSAGILGVAESFGQNLATDGAGAPVPPFGQITGSGSFASIPKIWWYPCEPTYPTVNAVSAVNSC